MSVGFGNLFRREVLLDLHSFSGGVGLDILLCPEFPPVLAAQLSMLGSSVTKKVTGGALNFHLNKELTPTVHSLGRLSLSNTDGVSGFAMLTHQLPDEGGQISLTALMDDSDNKIVGFRGQSKSMTLGLDIPTNAFDHSKAWVMSRISPSICLGLSGSPFNESLPVQFCVSLDKKIPNTDSSYCVSAAIESPSRDLTLGFSQHLVTHRKIYNPLEDKRVKYIANYIDIAVEGRTKDGRAGEVLAGISWQANKNLLGKVHVSTEHGAVVTGVVRNWWLPSFLASISAGVDIRGIPFIGGRIQVSNWLTTVEYERGQPVSQLPSTRWLSTEEVSKFSGMNRF